MATEDLQRTQEAKIYVYKCVCACVYIRVCMCVFKESGESGSWAEVG